MGVGRQGPDPTGMADAMVVRAPQRRYKIHVIPAKAGTQSPPSRKRGANFAWCRSPRYNWVPASAGVMREGDNTPYKAALS